MTIQQLRDWLIDHNINLKSYFIPKTDLLDMAKEIIMLDQIPKYLDIPKECIYILGTVLDPKSICMLASTCKRLYKVLSSGLIWLKHCNEIKYFSTLSIEEIGCKPDGYWKKWYNDHVSISIKLQPPVISTWIIGDKQKEIVIPTVGCLVYKTINVTDVDDPNGDIIVLTIKYVCISVKYNKKGFNKGLPKSFVIARNCDKNYKLRTGIDKYFDITLNTKQEYIITPKGNIPDKLTIISEANQYQ